MTGYTQAIVRENIANRSRISKLLYEYYNAAFCDEAAQGFEEHLLSCFQCQDKVFTLDLSLGLLPNTLPSPTETVDTTPNCIGGGRMYLPDCV